MKRPAALIALVLVATVAACTRPTGTVVGLLGYAGGPARDTPGSATDLPTMAGTVVISRDGIMTATARVADDGRFVVHLVPGVYRFSEARLGCATTARIRANETTTVHVICSIK